MTEKKRTITVTAALPYANGDIHLGHLVEYLQTDFWVRFQNMRGHTCRFFCADDTHGTPVMLKARELGIKPEDLILEKHREHLKDFENFEISFTNYDSTHSETNRNFANEIFSALRAGEHIAEKEIEQLYCEKDSMFLPDRFVRGECPKCGSADQYGDSCDKCSAVYSPLDMPEVRCAVCGNKPVKRKSTHVFVTLENFRTFLQTWVPLHTGKEINNKLTEWLSEPLKNWDISRDAPYFGFEIPGYPGKFFYVWVDAPIGYLTSAYNWCRANAVPFHSCWPKEENSGDAELYHFIGKDIVYFHTLFWPAMLKSAGYKTPDQIFVHGFLTINGEKMSKSKGTFINARTYSESLHPMYLRYYYACKITGTIDDIDLSVSDFILRVNSDLIGKITNLASRGAQILEKKLGGETGAVTGQGLELAEYACSMHTQIAACYEERNFAKAMTLIRDIADRANKYFDDMHPWTLTGSDPDAALACISAVLSVFRTIAVYLKPILPSYAANAEKLFGQKDWIWKDAAEITMHCQVMPYTHLASRIDPKSTEEIMERSKQEYTTGNSSSADYIEPPAGGEISIDDFLKVDLRVGKIISAEAITESEKLIRLKVDIGYETREVIAGIKQAYHAPDLPGRLVVIAANLKPRKMKFGTSHGMITAAGPGAESIFLLAPDSGAKPGMRVH